MEKSPLDRTNRTQDYIGFIYHTCTIETIYSSNNPLNIQSTSKSATHCDTVIYVSYNVTPIPEQFPIELPTRPVWDQLLPSTSSELCLSLISLSSFCLKNVCTIIFLAILSHIASFQMTQVL